MWPILIVDFSKTFVDHLIRDLCKSRWVPLQEIYEKYYQMLLRSFLYVLLSGVATYNNNLATKRAQLGKEKVKFREYIWGSSFVN